MRDVLTPFPMRHRPLLAGPAGSGDEAGEHVIELITADIGGTYARFAPARIYPQGQVELGEPIKLRTSDYAGLCEAWSVIGGRRGAQPSRAAIAVAGSMEANPLQLTNGTWTISRSTLEADLGVDRVLLINDFAAVGYAVSALGPEYFRPVCGPVRAFSDKEVISIIGPGTGLGIAHVVRNGSNYHVMEGEGGHAAFAPLDEEEDALLRMLRQRFGRVSVERIVSGPGLMNIFRAQAKIEGQLAGVTAQTLLWERALEGSDSDAAQALRQFCRAFGSIAGDIALVHGATAVVLAGGIGLLLAEHLPSSDFAMRFAAKGRFAERMANMPVTVLTHPEPGLYGAACACSRRI